MAKDPLSQLSNVNAGLDQTIKKLNVFESILKRIGGIATKSLDSVTRLLMPNVGMGPGLGLGTANAQFSNGAGGTPQGGATNAMPWIYSKQGAASVAGLQVGLGLAAGAYAAMPDLGMTVSRATGFFQSSLRTGGGINRAGVAAATFSALGGGITGLGEDAAAAAVLSQGFNFMPGTSSFNRMMQEVGGAARGFGMANATAAMAIGGMHTGRMGAQLYQYGINTTDPNTGEPLPFEQIARQLYNRMTMNGRLNPSAEEMATNLRAGFGSKDMQMFSAEQRAILEPMLINMAAGKPLGSLANMPFNPDNPLNAQMKIATSTTSLMERGTEPMISGFEKAANAVAALNKSLEGLPDAFFQLKGAVQGFSGTNVGAGVSGVVGGIAGAASTLLVARGARSVLGGAASKAGQAATSTVGKVGLTGLGRAVPVLGGAVAGATGQGFLSTVAIGAAAGGIGGSFFGGVGAVPGAIGGGILSGLGWIGSKAISSMFGTPANAATTLPASSMAGKVPDKLIKGTQDQQDWAKDFLTQIGAPITSENLAAMTTWMAYEGGHWKNSATYNPLNTTLKTSASTGSINDVGVQKYSSYTGGLSATVQTINNGRYGNILDALRQGNNSQAVLSAVAASPWGTFKSGSSTTQSSVGNKTVNITVNLANASTAEANRLAKQVKEILLKDKDLQEVGSK